MALETPPDHLAVTGASGPPIPPVGRRTRRWRVAAPLVALIALAFAMAACSPPGSPGSGATGDMVQAVNDDRAAAGLGPVAWDGQLAQLAQSHAEEIAASGTLWHSDLAGWLASPWMSGWHSLGENVLVAVPGSNAFQAEDQWMASGPHRANILNPEFNRIGVGVKVDGSGRIWMVALFGAR